MKRTLSGLMLLALTSFPAAAQAPQARQFLQATQYLTGANSNPQAFAVADFNNDGFQDVAVADSGTNSVSIFLGKGDGTFVPVKCGGTATCPTGSNPQGIAAGDFNQDGNVDLAVTNSISGTLTILFGNGQGSFAAQSSAPVTGKNPRGIAVADFNGDGFKDIVVTNSGDGNVGLFLNNGHGGFGAQTTYTTGFNPWAVAVGDFNNDGLPDIVVANNNNNNTVSVYLGVKAGGFSTQLQASTGIPNEGSPVAVAVGDFNGDSFLDVAVAVEGDAGGQDMVSVLSGNGKGGFAAPTTYPTAPFPVAIAATDLNGDGTVDLAVAAANGNVVTVFWGNGDGSFSGQVNCGTGDIPSAVATADLNNDGKSDLIVSNSQGNSFSVIINNGSNSFQSRLDYVAGTNAYSVASGDFNGDGIPDLAFADRAESEISVTLGNGDGTFRAPQYFSTGTATQPIFIVEGDFNNDHIPDLAVANYATSTVSVFLGEPGPNNTVTFQSRSDYPVGNQNLVNPNAEPTSIAIGDFNGDGYLDLAVTNFNENSVSILLNQGNGLFAPAPNCSISQNACAVGTGPIDVAVGHFTGGQKLDLVVINESANNATILLGNGDGTFTAEPTPTAVGGNPLSVAVADLNGDGIPDLAVADFQTQQVSILLGNGSNGVGNGTFQTAAPYSTGATNPSAVVIGDFNGDGIPDLALTSTPSGGNPGNQVSLLWGLANPQGKPNGTFSNIPALFGAGYLSYSLVIGDFNLDGAPDLAVANGGSNTVSILLNLQGTKIDFTPTPAQLIYGESLELTATVTASVSNGATPTGTVTFENGSTVIGTAQTLSNGQASISTSSLPAGTDSLAAVYSGDSNYQTHTVYLSQKVSTATSNTSLNSSSNPSAPSQTATFTASVTSPTAQPSGTVTFVDGSTSLGTGVLNGSGQATFSTSALATGTHNITAVYAGNSNITGSTSTVLQQVIGVVTSPNFSLTADWSTSNNIAPGSTATAQVTINPAGGLDPASVKLSCSVSPSATPAATCQLGSVAVANGKGTATLTFQTAGPTSALMAPSDSHGSNMLFAVGFMIPALLLGGAGWTKPRRKRFTSFCLFLALAGCLAHVACGGSTHTSTTTPPPSGNSGTPAGAYQVMVSGSASGISNSIATPLSVTVQ